MKRCSLWPRNGEEFKRRFKGLSYETCCLISELCNERAVGIDLQRGIIYLERDESPPVLEELIRSRVLLPLADEGENSVELRGVECSRYMVELCVCSKGEGE